MLVLIVNSGCDDITKGLVEVNEKELELLCETFYFLNKNSSYGCMPTIELYKIQEDKLRELPLIGDLEEEEEDFNANNVLYFKNGKRFTFLGYSDYYYSIDPEENLIEKWESQKFKGF